jgi:hypothetical protein
MNKQNTITINGVQYDERTGMRMNNVPTSTQHNTPQSPHSHSLHTKAARTQTLRRSHIQSPLKAHAHTSAIAPKKHTKSPMVHKFSPSQVAQKQPTRIISDMAPVKHPVHVAAQVKHAAKKQHAHQSVAQKHLEPKPAAHVKETAITKAMHNSKPHKQVKQSFAKRHPKLVSAGTASLAVVLLAGYMTYINLPNLSVKVAAIQAGVDASYPSYQPSGYSLNGPVAYSNGEVSMKFAANVGPQDFTVSQTKSSWDSSALLDNLVQPSSDGNYATFNDSGLTIYIYDTNAAWVNGGILYTIEGNAPLSNDQIRRIATSM